MGQAAEYLAQAIQKDPKFAQAWAAAAVAMSGLYQNGYDVDRSTAAYDTQGECLAGGFSWDNWLPDIGRTVKNIKMENLRSC